MPNRRRIVGAAVCLLPVAVVLASLLFALASPGVAPFRGIWLMAGAAAIAALNFSVCYIRPLIHRLRFGSLSGYRFKSGIPGVGNLLAVAAAVWGFGATGTAIAGLVTLAFDTGGSVWFLVGTWRDDSFWAPGPPAGAPEAGRGSPRSDGRPGA